jgi:hypothetical protein
LPGCAADLLKINLQNEEASTKGFQAAVWKLPKHACVSHSPTGAYIVTIYGVHRATEE